jgi:hypothetical protein
MRDHERRTVSSTLSADVVNYLCAHGRKQSDIARMMHVSEGFVSLVKSRERCLTLDHLELVTDFLSVPLGAFLLAVAEPKTKNLDPEQKKLVETTSRILRKADEATNAIMRSKHLIRRSVMGHKSV